MNMVKYDKRFRFYNNSCLSIVQTFPDDPDEDTAVTNDQMRLED